MSVPPGVLDCSIATGPRRKPLVETILEVRRTFRESRRSGMGETPTTGSFLDEFEGRRYERILVPVERAAEEVVIANVYAHRTLGL
jgi:hypothetical protein